MIRVFLLRVLLAWWFIPFAIVVNLPLIVMLFGIQDGKEFCRIVYELSWDGVFR